MALRELISQKFGSERVKYFSWDVVNSRCLSVLHFLQHTFYLFPTDGIDVGVKLFVLLLWSEGHLGLISPQNVLSIVYWSHALCWVLPHLPFHNVHVVRWYVLHLLSDVIHLLHLSTVGSSFCFLCEIVDELTLIIYHPHFHVLVLLSVFP